MQVLAAINRIRRRTYTPLEHRLKAKEFCIKLNQNISLAEEISALKCFKTLPKNSQILNLNCYIDEQGILRSESQLINISKNDFVSNRIILDANKILS